MALANQDDECSGCVLCAPQDGAYHVFRKREHAKDKRKRRGGRRRQEKRRAVERISRSPCDCWLCTPGYLKRRMLQERERSRELQNNRVTYTNRACVEW
jgi:hypothetical protein